MDMVVRVSCRGFFPSMWKAKIKKCAFAWTGANFSKRSDKDRIPVHKEGPDVEAHSCLVVELLRSLHFILTPQLLPTSVLSFFFLSFVFRASFLCFKMVLKAWLVLGVLMAALLIVSSDATAREMAETAKEEQTKDAVEDQYGGHCRYRCCRWYGGRCVRCCSHATEVPEVTTQDAVEDQYGCRHGCCKWFHHRCIRCCYHKN
ncbi:hypothetical protein Taro_050256 [Colocasia esculenta]|uniref:CYC02 protein n=1 Tax=Colocasia esculenta TaxID=4460 RepID=A0A843XCY2_COLES|nr:hypothetical protein [Colocasia esculenta]